MLAMRMSLFYSRNSSIPSSSSQLSGTSSHLLLPSLYSPFTLTSPDSSFLPLLPHYCLSSPPFTCLPLLLPLTNLLLLASPLSPLRSPSIAHTTGKEIALEMIGHSDPAIQTQALQCISKIMVANWEFMK